MTNEERNALIAQGWTPPPEPVDPDIAEAEKIYVEWDDYENNGERLLLQAIKRGRELERQEPEPEPEVIMTTIGKGVTVQHYADGAIEQPLLALMQALPSNMSHATDVLARLEEQGFTVYKKKVFTNGRRRATATPITPALVNAICNYYNLNTNLTQQDIANHFNVNISRVNEALKQMPDIQGDLWEHL